ncbi:Gfo/Idh/MocA family protein [Alkalibacterium sp. 20]|uniref:Gfo/Idh/MocA family protein n=1 Tax=Alkalibacterium sp. 20 TaxID=1798803 RepID=UPI00090016F4|nr:Gfo/Idh/MocA family oxidoreductase [Alkalibacterium sp. 20]OJF91562.1 oxidoreductase [Alkalibacterium sp. 20]
MKIINWGIIGLGDIAHQFASQFESDNANLLGVASRTLQKAFEFSKKHDIKKAYGSYEELAYDPEIDIVYIATPNSSHYADMLMLLKAGKHVLCEKPITLNRTQLNTVLNVAQSKNLLCAEAMTIYHMPLYKELKTNIQGNKYGKLKMIHTLFGNKQVSDPTNRFYDPDLGGGALLDIGVYALSFIRYFLSSQPEVKQTTVLLNETGVDESSSFHFRNKQGEIGTAALSFIANMPIQGVIVCENAYITVSDYPRASKATVTYSNGTTEEINLGDSSKALTYEIQAISQTLLSENDFSFLSLTRDVNELIDWAAKEWEMSWVFKDEK